MKFAPRYIQTPRNVVIFATSLAFLTGLSFTSQQALAFGGCVKFCGGGSSSSSGSSSGGGRSYFPSRPSRPSARDLRYRKATRLNQTGVRLYKKGDYAKAAAFFRRALALAPNDPTIKRNFSNANEHLGLAAYRRGDYATAAKHFRKGLAIFPKDRKNQRNLRNVEQHLKRKADARRRKYNRMLDDLSRDFSAATTSSQTSSAVT